MRNPPPLPRELKRLRRLPPPLPLPLLPDPPVEPWKPMG